jgi:hypothetical protein
MCPQPFEAHAGVIDSAVCLVMNTTNITTYVSKVDMLRRRRIILIIVTHSVRGQWYLIIVIQIRYALFWDFRQC